jgi:hypothetical protein
MASDTAAIAQRGLAAFGGVAIQEAMLAFAPDFRRLILTFHCIIKIKQPLPLFPGSDTPLLRPNRHSELEKIPVEPKVSTAQLD